MMKSHRPDLMHLTHAERHEAVRAPFAREVKAMLAAHSDPVEVVHAIMSGLKASSAQAGGCILDALVDREVERRSAHTYAALCRDLQRTDFHRTLVVASGQQAANLQVTYAQAWHLRKFYAAGQRTYQVSPGLASRLVRTRLNGLTTDYLCDTAVLPYQAIYIIVPPEAGLTVENKDSGTHPVEGMYLTCDVNEDGTPAWRIMVVGAPRDGDIYDDALFHFIVPLPPGMPLDAAIEREHERIMGRIEGGYIDAAERKCVDLMPALFTFAMNVIIYATSSDARRSERWNRPDAERLMAQAAKHPKGSHKGDRAREALRAANLKRRTYLGGGLPILSGEGTPHGPLVVRTLVEGHWRNQAHGPRHSLRKVIWIAPFWRGPDGAPESSPVHVVR